MGLNSRSNPSPEREIIQIDEGTFDVQRFERVFWPALPLARERNGNHDRCKRAESAKIADTQKISIRNAFISQDALIYFSAG